MRTLILASILGLMVGCGQGKVDQEETLETTEKAPEKTVEYYDRQELYVSLLNQVSQTLKAETGWSLSKNSIRIVELSSAEMEALIKKEAPNTEGVPEAFCQMTGGMPISGALIYVTPADNAQKAAAIFMQQIGKCSLGIFEGTVPKDSALVTDEYPNRYIMSERPEFADESQMQAAIVEMVKGWK